MEITIHRGTHEIGGSCIELRHADTRLVIDIGMPLIATDGGRFDMQDYKDLSGCQLVEKGVLPKISGFYRWDVESKPIDALLVSHAHFDHYGFASYLRDDIKYHLGEGTQKLMEISSIFSGHNSKIERYKTFNSGKSFSVGSITITPYLTDHSAFDAYSFLIEAGGKRVLYTGDFRDHGRKLGLLKRMIKGVAEGIDAILLEGTLIGRDGEQKSENDIEYEFCELFRSNSNTVFIAASGQNIDRMVSVYRAAKRSGRILVMDPYVAHVLTSLSGLAKLPYPSPEFPDIRVFFPQRFCSWLSKNGKEDLFKRYSIFKISRQELHRKRSRVAMLIRPSLLDYLKKMEGIDGATVVWSQWEGYLKDDKANTKNLTEFIKQRDMKFQTIHTSGHATIDTMKNLVAALKPKVIIPIHTNHPERYAEIFPETTIADVHDRVAIEI